MSGAYLIIMIGQLLYDIIFINSYVTVHVGDIIKQFIIIKMVEVYLTPGFVTISPVLFWLGAS